MDEKIQQGKDWLENLLKLMNIPTTVQVGRIEQNQDNSTSCWLTIDETKITESQIEMLIGKKGETIDSIQYLLNTVLNIPTGDQKHCSFTVELNGYRIARQAELFALAQNTASRVRQTGLPEELTYLSSPERRQIHSFLEKSEDLETESKGQEPERRLIVRLRS